MARKKYSCDFETTTDLEDCRVWAYGYMEIGNISNYKIGNSMEEFMDFCKKSLADLYFHNLKFDGAFIVNWLLKNGFKYSNTPTENTFKTSISNMGQWYMIDICYGFKGKNKKHTVIYDSLKKLPFPVKSIAKDFKLTILKGDIDYHAFRPVGHAITDEEYAYIKNDIQIIAEALHIQFEQGLTKMTNGSDSINGFKDIFTKKKFEAHFPILDFDYDQNIRRAYRGGFTWLNKIHASKTIHEGMVFDVNSLYPSVMYDRLLPYGTPIYYTGEYKQNDNYPLYIQHIRCEFILKEGFIPTIQIKGDNRFRANEYLENSKGEVVDLYMTNIDMDMFLEHYHVMDLSYVSGYMFKGKKGMFCKFIDYWTEIKINGEGAIKALAKLMLNSLYGKFASNPKLQNKIPGLNPDGSNRFDLGEEDVKDSIYVPMGTFVTSYARHLTIGTAQSVFDRIIYCDTDSIHLVGTEIPESIKDIIDPDALGMWDWESTFKRAKYIRQKTYVQELYVKDNGKGKMVRADKDTYDDIKFSVKCAGMPDKVKQHVTFDNFMIGFSSPGKLKPKQVSGGVVLVDGMFTIK